MPPVPTQPFKSDEVASGSTVGGVLSLNYSLVWEIPKHQRAYSWEATKGFFEFDSENKKDDEIIDFLEDIEHARTGTYTHNFGTIEAKFKSEVNYLKHSNSLEPTHKLHHHEINDGQQRLTSIFLIYSALTQIRKLDTDNTYYDHFFPLITNDLTTSFELYHPTRNTKSGTRLSFQEPVITDSFLEILKLGDGYCFVTPPRTIKLTENQVEESNYKYPDGKLTIAPIKRLINAYILIRQYLGILHDENKLDDWETTFFNSEIVVSLSKTPSHILFDVRNDRGREVTGLDKVKNRGRYLEQKLRDDGVVINTDIARNWWEATKHMETGFVYDEKQLLGHVRSIVNGSATGATKQDYRGFKKDYDQTKLGTDVTLQKSYDDFANAIEWVAEAMKEIYRPHPLEKTYIMGSLLQMRNRGMDNKQFTEANYQIVNISKRLSKTEIFSTIIILIYRFTSPERFIEFLSLLEKIIFRLFTVDGSERQIRNGSSLFGKECATFFQLVKDKNPSILQDANDIETAAITFQNNLCNWAKKEYPLPEFYRDLMLPKNRYKTHWTRYLLYHWEMAGPGTKNYKLRLSKNASNWSDTERNSDEFTIEHIMADKGYKVQNPKSNKSYWSEIGSENDYDEFKNHLGNLVLSKWMYNADYDNNPYRRDPSDKEDEKYEMYKNGIGLYDWKKVRQVALNYDKWNLTTIQDRHRRIASWAVEYWRFPCEDPLPIPPFKIIEEHSQNFRKNNVQKTSKTTSTKTPPADTKPKPDTKSKPLGKHQDDIHDEGGWSINVDEDIDLDENQNQPTLDEKFQGDEEKEDIQEPDYYDDEDDFEKAFEEFEKNAHEYKEKQTKKSN